MSENRMTPPAEGQEKDVLLVLDKQQGKVSAVKEFDKGGIMNFFSSIHLVKRVLETIFACNIENDGIPAFPRISRLRFLKF